MIYLFAGDDIPNRLSAYETFIKSVPSEAEIFKFNRNDFNPDQIGSFYSGARLFGKKSTVVFLNFCEYEETRIFILGKLSLMADSGNFFVFVEGKLTKDILDAFKKAREEKIPNFTGITAPYEEPVNPEIVIDSDSMTLTSLASPGLSSTISTRSGRDPLGPEATGPGAPVSGGVDMVSAAAV